MKRFYPIIVLSLFIVAAHARNPESEIPDFNLDDFYVEPKFSLSVGARVLNGSEVAFGGQGVIPAIGAIQGPTDTGVIRLYNDGYVLPDKREGAADGKTNTWSYADADQVVDGGANIALHQYTAQITDTTTRQGDPGMSIGTELVLSRDMGKIGSKLEWKLFAGIGVNGISGSAHGSVDAIITTVTDTYSLGGQTLSSVVPYQAPSSIVDENGTVIDTTILLGQMPDNRVTSSAPNSTQITNFWKLKGTYLTLRLGPTLTFNFTNNFRLSLSAGPTLVYSGTNYSVEQTFVPDTGDTVITTVSESDEKALTGYYVDATLEYLITERAGLYAGAFYQTSGDYTSTLTENGASYTTNVSLAKLQGFRAGLNFKF